MAQVLPANEDFDAPVWLKTSASTPECLPWYFWYLGFKPSDGIDSSAAEYSTYPYRLLDGELQTFQTQELYIENGGAFPVFMTDTTGFLQSLQRAVLCREEDSVAVEDIDCTVTFGLMSVGGSALGSSQAGTSGRSPTPGGSYPFPGSNPLDTTDNHRNQTGGPLGNWVSAGPMSGISIAEKPPDLWTLWNGNSIFFRAGGGNPEVKFFQGTPDRSWYCTHVSHYSFCAYPVVNSGADRVDLYLELWQVKFVNGTASGGTPRRLIQQVVDGGASTLDVRHPYHLRVKCDNNATNVDINAYIGAILRTGQSKLAEAQCFKAGVFPNDTFNVGTDVTHNSSTGNVEDRHADKITAYTGKSFGWGMGTERIQNVGNRINPASPTIKNASGREGVYSVEVKDISAGTVLYRDEFQRSVTHGGPTPHIINEIEGQFGSKGSQANGLFTFDGYASQFGSGGQEVRRLILWTDGQNDATNPNDYVTLDYDADSGTTGQVLNRMRSFVHQRPSSQFYNHHRSIQFKPGAETNNVSGIEYEIGIALRGTFNGRTCDATVAYLYWNTDGNNTITYAKLEISSRLAQYNQNPSAWSVVPIARKVWTSSFPTLYDGSWHTLDFKAEIYSGASSPEAAAEYHIELDGSPLELDDSSLPQQSSTTTPFGIVENGPMHFSGNQEGFWFYSSVSELDTGGTRNYALTIAQDWLQGINADDPGEPTEDDQPSIVVGGEGSAVGALNTSGGALGISGSGVWEVEVTVRVESSMGIYRSRFDSGHTYTSPATSKARRQWEVTVRAADLAICQSLQTFYNDHNGMETPFSFVVPVLDDGSEAGHTAEDSETVVAWFASDALVIREVGPQVFDISFSVEEEIVA